MQIGKNRTCNCAKRHVRTYLEVTVKLCSADVFLVIMFAELRVLGLNTFEKYVIF